MSLKYRVMSLIEAGKWKYDVIAHGCNCFCTMGSGIAPLIAKAFPDAYEIDQQTRKGDESKLGGYTYAYDYKYDLVIFNLYTQFGFWKRRSGGRDVEYPAVRSALQGMREALSKSHTDALIALPKIGAGLAGGDWGIISQIIEEELVDKGYDVTICVLDEKEIPEGGIKV